jgi:hypothetical protein
MKLLRISNNNGEFLTSEGQYLQIDQINKDDLLRLVNLTIEKDPFEFDQYDENAIKNLAHRVIYKSVIRKLEDLRARRKEFADEAARLFHEDYEKYRQE